MYWAFKTYHNRDFYNKVLSQAEEADFTFSQHRHFSGKMGDSVLILDTENEWKFTYQAEIAKITVVNEKEAEQSGYYVYLIVLTEFKKLNASPLSDFAFSLHKVYKRFSQPYRHFTRKPYSRLVKLDFETIINDRIFIKRTCVGMLLKALHRGHQKEVLSILMTENPAYFFGSIDYDKIFLLLKRYIDEHIMGHAFMLLDSESLLNNIQIDPSLVRFQDTDSSADRLTAQAKVIKDAFKESRSGENIDTILSIRQIADSSKQELPIIASEYFFENLESGISENKSTEDRFNRSFKRAPFPLQLN